jgi:hypothetical protein
VELRKLQTLKKGVEATRSRAPVPVTGLPGLLPQTAQKGKALAQDVTIASLLVRRV